MLLCQVLGSVVATAKSDGLRGAKLMLVQERSPSGELSGNIFVATDQVGAGAGEVVLVVTGSAARAVMSSTPTDAAIVGIVDRAEVNE